LPPAKILSTLNNSPPKKRGKSGSEAMAPSGKSGRFAAISGGMQKSSADFAGSARARDNHCDS
jgi:hypothetical protein